jgi:hypothetical protein
VEREDKEEADAQDAWLLSDEGAAERRCRCCFRGGPAVQRGGGAAHGGRGIRGP